MQKKTVIAVAALAALSALAEPVREWDWHLPGTVYRNLEFADRAAVDRAVKLFQQAVDAERKGVKVTELVPRYRAAAGEWRKVQVQGEAQDFNAPLLGYAVFMQGYARMQAHDRNEAIRLFEETLDLYGDQKFVAVAARYMLARVRREMGDVKLADAALEAIAEDGAADGHAFFYSVLRDRAALAWDRGRADEARELWSRIVFTSGKPDRSLWGDARSNLAFALVTACDLGELTRVLTAGLDEGKRRERAAALADHVQWFANTDRYPYHTLTRWLDARWPKDKKASERAAQLAKIRRAYAAWLDGEASVFAGVDDGWMYARAGLRAHGHIESRDALLRRADALLALAKGAKDGADARVRSLALELSAFGLTEAAEKAAAALVSPVERARLQCDLANAAQNWPAYVLALEAYVGLQPPPPPEDLKRARYDLAWAYRNRVGKSEKAVPLYREIDDPPKSLWGLAEALRESGKKGESYQVLVEIVSMFPNDAAEAVLRTAQWREKDGEKEKAIGLYRRILKHPQWKSTRASSEAHQALERHGVLTGGAMTNEVR